MARSQWGAASAGRPASQKTMARTVSMFSSWYSITAFEVPPAAVIDRYRRPASSTDPSAPWTRPSRESAKADRSRISTVGGPSSTARSDVVAIEDASRASVRRTILSARCPSTSSTSEAKQLAVRKSARYASTEGFSPISVRSIATARPNAPRAWSSFDAEAGPFSESDCISGSMPNSRSLLARANR